MFRSIGSIAVLAAVLGANLASAQFTDITESSGLGPIVDARYAAFPDWWLSGLHFIDLDDDGKLDRGRIVRHPDAGADSVVEISEDGDPIFANGVE